jgi:hypothetical protein
MGQLLHGSARTTAAVRRAIRYNQESLAELAKRYDLAPKNRGEVEAADAGARCAYGVRRNHAP